MIEPIVCVPARNEAERLPSLLRALADQTWLQTSRKSLRTVLVLNNCADGSADIVQGMEGELPRISLHVITVQFPPKLAHVGSARRLAMETGLGLGPKASLLLTTDADAVPRRDWIDANLRVISEGADLVGGLIVGDPREEAQLGPGFVRRAKRHLHYAKLVDRLTSLLNPIPHDPWPRHSDHSGASLAVRGEVYAAVGGMPALPVREDLAFVERVCRAGYRLRHPLDVQVIVSARLDGRAPGGMSDCLKAWLDAERDGQPHLVDDPEALVVRLRHRQQEPAEACAIRLPRLDDHLRVPCGMALPELPRNRRANRVDIELAISEISRMIADKEGEANVRGSKTMDFLQRAD
jgi:hypothetical protein